MFTQYWHSFFSIWLNLTSLITEAHAFTSAAITKTLFNDSKTIKNPLNIPNSHLEMNIDLYSHLYASETTRPSFCIVFACQRSPGPKQNWQTALPSRGNTEYWLWCQSYSKYHKCRCVTNNPTSSSTLSDITEHHHMTADMYLQIVANNPRYYQYLGILLVPRSSELNCIGQHKPWLLPD